MAHIKFLLCLAKLRVLRVVKLFNIARMIIEVAQELQQIQLLAYQVLIRQVVTYFWLWIGKINMDQTSMLINVSLEIYNIVVSHSK